MSRLSVAIATASLGAVQANLEFVKGGKTLCAAASEDLEVFLASNPDGAFACTEKGNSPSEYMEMKVTNMAFLKTETGYVNDPTEMKEVKPSTEANNPNLTLSGKKMGNSCSKPDETPCPDENQIAYAMAGTLMGEKINAEDAHAFVGTANYIMQKGTFAFNTNDFFVPKNDWTGFEEVKDICIVKPDEQGKCGAKREVSAGEYKFSLYGKTAGTKYEQFITDGEYKFVGIRQTIDISGMGESATVKDNVVFNTDKTIDNIATTGVQSIKVTGVQKSELSLTYPQEYNYGTVGAKDAAPWKIGTSEAIKIHALPVADEKQKFTLDFIFKVENQLNVADKYFVYDPEVTITKAGEAKPSSTAAPKNSSTSSAFGTSVFTAMVGTVLALFF